MTTDHQQFRNQDPTVRSSVLKLLTKGLPERSCKGGVFFESAKKGLSLSTFEIQYPLVSL